MVKEKELNVDNIDFNKLSFDEIVMLVERSNNIEQAIKILSDIARHGSIEQIANLSFLIIEKYNPSATQEPILYELSLMTAGEEGEFDLPIEEIIKKVNLLSRKE